MMKRHQILQALALMIAMPAAAQPAAQVFDGRLIDGSGAAPVTRGRVVISGGRIVCAGTRRACPAPRGAERIDAGTGTIMPGLIDLHVHPRPHYIAWFPAAGVTAIRAASISPDMLAAVRGIPAALPRIVAAGPMIDGPETIIARFFAGAPEEARLAAIHPPGRGPLAGTEVLTVATPAEARAAVEEEAAAGAQWIKLYERIPAPAYAAAAERARQLNIPVMTDLGMMFTRGFDGAEVDAVQAAAMGVATLEHGSGLALAYRRAGGDPAAAALDPSLVGRLADALRRHDVALIPTFSVFAGIAAGAPFDLAGSGLPMADANGEAADGLRAQWSAIHAGSASTRGRAQGDVRLTTAVMRALVARGGRVGAGSDTPAGSWNLPGGGLHRELELLVAAGLTPLQAIHAATGGAAGILRNNDIGLLAPGRTADLLIVAGDPSRDITATRRLVTIVIGGRRHDPAELRRAALAVPVPRR